MAYSRPATVTVWAFTDTSPYLDDSDRHMRFKAYEVLAWFQDLTRIDLACAIRYSPLRSLFLRGAPKS